MIVLHDSPHLRVVAASEPTTECFWFVINGHQVPRDELISMIINLTSTPGTLCDGQLTAFRSLGGIFTDDELSEIGFDMAGP